MQTVVPVAAAGSSLLAAVPLIALGIDSWCTLPRKPPLYHMELRKDSSVSSPHLGKVGIEDVHVGSQVNYCVLPSISSVPHKRYYKSPLGNPILSALSTLQQ